MQRISPYDDAPFILLKENKTPNYITDELYANFSLIKHTGNDWNEVSDV